MLFDILAFISVLAAILLLKRLVNLLPSLTACAVRWKESIKLENSVKDSSDRDLIALAMIMPFCLIVERYRLYDLDFMAGMGENLRIGIVAGVFVIYMIVRKFVSITLHNGKISKKPYEAAEKAAYTFFILLTLILTVMAGVLSFLDIEAEVVKIVMLWVSAFMYLLYILRKTQIFNSNRSIFTGILYLCALEFVPTGLLVASAIIF